MSDHVDGPRQMGDPAADLSDLFAFVSPENTGRLVIAANVFPSAGITAIFSNAIDHSIVVRRAQVAGLGESARFETGDPEYRFSFRFENLKHGTGSEQPVQRGSCALPGGQTLQFVVNDEKGALSPDGSFRVFAGLRSDPFFLAWLPATLTKFHNLLEHDNVLSVVVEFDTQRVLDPDKGSLFAVIAETKPVPRASSYIGHEPPRMDWVGRPEQTNFRLNNPAMAGSDDLRDLWNQQAPFAISEEFRPLFHKRMLDSLANWDMRDGKVDWSPAELADSANVFVEDFLLIDVSKPTTDSSFFEIEKSTLNGRAYQKGGGRTVNANVIDILLTWMVNHDKGEFLQGGATGATKPGLNSFPYLASPNMQLQIVTESVELSATPDEVWALIGPFGGEWNPLIAKIDVSGTGVGQLRTLESIDGKAMIERLEAVDDSQKSYRYSVLSGIPAVDCTGMLSVKPAVAGSYVEWRVQYLADGQPDIIVQTIVSTLIKAGIAALKSRFGGPK